MLLEGQAHFGACEHIFGLTKIVPGVKYRFICLLYDSWELQQKQLCFGSAEGDETLKRTINKCL